MQQHAVRLLTLLLTAGPVMAAPQPACTDLAALPTAVPQGALKVTDFGAKPNDEGDDTAAIQRAIDALKPGQWLVFPPGRYLHNTALQIKQNGVTLWGTGATLHATQPKSQAVVLAEDNVSLLNFTLTSAEAEKRGSEPPQSRIAVWRGDKPGQGVRGAVVRGNRIQPPPAAPDSAHSAASAGIFLYHASDFVVADNHIERTMADGIHITAGSHHGRVLRNTLNETGDDMIGMVSYLGDGQFTRNTAAELASSLASRTEAKLVHDVLVADNKLSGAYWGRGISVVGGRDITIYRNQVTDSTRAAAIYLAREANYVTFGVRNVRVQDNTIERVQTTEPRRSKRGFNLMEQKRTGHAAIQVHADLLEDERAQPALAEWLDIQDIAVINNRVNGSASDGLRVNDTRSGSWRGAGTMRGKRDDGTQVERRLVPASVRGVWVQSNQFKAVRGAALAWPKDDGEEVPVHCAGNRLDDKDIDATLKCAAPSTPQRSAAGAALSSCAMP